jgi:hypothetical protein
MCQALLHSREESCGACGDHARSRAVRHVAITIVCILIALPVSCSIGYLTRLTRPISTSCLRSLGITMEGVSEDGHISTRHTNYANGTTTTVTGWDPGEFGEMCVFRLAAVLFLLLGVALPYGLLLYLIVTVHLKDESSKKPCDQHKNSTRYYSLVMRFAPGLCVPDGVVPVHAIYISRLLQVILCIVCVALPAFILFSYTKP